MIKVFGTIFGIISLLAAVILLCVIFALPEDRDLVSYPKDGAIVLNRAVVTVDGRSEEVSLPRAIRTSSPRTRVTVQIRLPASDRGAVYLKTIYCPLTVRLDGAVLSQLGVLSNYPAFMKDPATEVKFLPVPDSGEERTLELDFLSPFGRDYVMVYPLVAGRAGPISAQLFRQGAATIALSVLQIFIGILIMLTTSVRLRKETEIRPFFWLGLFSFFTGMWGICESNLTLWVVDQPVALYLLDFFCLECTVIPFVRFYGDLLERADSLIFSLLRIASEAIPAASLFLQLSGAAPFYRTVRGFHFVAIVIFALVFFLTAREYMLRRDALFAQLLVSLGILLLFLLLEVSNYYVHLTWQNSFFFCAGLSLFIIFSGMCCVYNFTSIYRRKQQLEMQLNTMNVATGEMKKHVQLIMENNQETREQRHNYRQNLIAIRGLASEGRTEALMRYIDTVIDQIPGAVRTYCESPSINAVVSHYASLCAQEGIEFSARIVLPAEGLPVTDVDLCTLFGNLLENALEACRNMSSGKRFICVSALTHLDTLAISVGNSFDGVARRSGDLFLSGKRGNRECGIGLASVRSIARKYHGDANFDAAGKEFSSYVYLFLI